MKYILLTCLGLILACSALLAQAPTVYLPLDQDLNDASGNNLHATDAGTVSTTFENDPQRGTVAHFAAAAHATLPIDPKLDFGTNDFSVAFWIKVPATAPLPTSDPVIVGNKDWDSGGNVGFLVALDGADDAGSHRWTVNVADGSQRLDWDADNNGAPSLVDGTWHFVAVTFDRNATMNVYLDGVLKQTDVSPGSKDMTLIPGDLAPNDKPFTIMQDNTGVYGADFAGYLDDILIYDRVLATEEVASLNENGYSVDPALGATVYLPFDGDLLDKSGNSLDGVDAGIEATKFVNDGERGTVADFPVAAHVTLPLDPKLDFGTGDFTVSFWTKIGNTPPLPTSDPVIVGNKDWDSGGNVGFLVALDGADEAGSHMWTVNVADGSGRLDWDADDNGTPNLVDANWHFVAVAFDRDATMNVYLDGVLKQTDVAPDSKDMTLVPGDLAPNDKPFTIMQDNTGAYGADFAGKLDDIRIWTGKALSADEILAVYNFKPESEPGNDLAYGADVYLPFDADLTDATGHVDAEDKGSVPVTFVEDVKRGKVASFETQAHAQFPLVPELDFGTDDFSFAFWIKINAGVPIPSDPAIFTNKDWDSGGNVGFLVALDDADAVDAHHWTVNVADGTGRLDWDADDNETPNLKDGEWHFIAVAFDRDAKLNVYYDGLLRQTDAAQDSYDLTLAPGSLSSGLPLTIMQDATGGYVADFAAFLDDLRIWKGKVLTAQEIATMYKPEDKAYGATVFLPLNSSLGDFSGNNLHASDAGVGTTEFIKDPDRGDVALFPTDAHAQFPLVPELDFGTIDFSVAFWVRINPLIPVSSDPVIVGNKDWNSGENNGFAIGPVDPDDAGSHRWYVNAADGTNRLDWNADTNGASSLKDGKWHFVAVAFDRSARMNVYFDGALKQTDASPNSFDMAKITGSLTSGLPLTLMQDGTGTYSADFSALLDNVRIWNRVVTPAEVSDMFANDKGSGQGGEVEIILGNEEEMEVEPFALYPNPLRSGSNIQIKYQFTKQDLSGSGEIRLTLLNSMGTAVRSSAEKVTEQQGVITMDGPYDAGLYLMRVESQKTLRVLKFMVVR
ncbi:MAG TPA: LamG-like jellyroll fold domain-containing protein [Chryseolinea sp.]|nr:LamG-like jellyroll fold domain-containing protein [Chryseolinea sp.]